MKLSGIFAVLSLSVMVKGAFWAAAVQPVILGLGAIFAALDSDLEPMQDVKFEFAKLLTFKNEKQNLNEKVEALVGPEVPYDPKFKGHNDMVDKEWTFRDNMVEKPNVPGDT